MSKSNLNARGSLHVALGRGRTGKTTNLRYLYERAVDAGRPVAVIDVDRTNSTMASFVSAARRPMAADDNTCLAFLETIIEEAIEKGGEYLLDMGGGDRLFLTFSERFDLPKLLQESRINLVLHHYAAGGRDDFETLSKCVGLKLKSDRTIIYFNEGLSGGAFAAGLDPFTALLSGASVKSCLNEGARVVRIPAVPPATMAMADALFIGIRQAAMGQVPVDDRGQPAEGAIALGVFRRLELKQWLETMEKQYMQAGVTEWLP